MVCLDTFVFQCSLACLVTFHLFRAESPTEENRARRRRGLPEFAENHGPSSDWTYLLTDKQRGYLIAFQQRRERRTGRDSHADAACAVDLGQRAEHNSCNTASLPVLRKGSHRVWSTQRRRWLLKLERAAAMGYPVYDDLARAANVETDHALPSCADSAIGNAMHVASVGTLFCLAQLCTAAV